MYVLVIFFFGCISSKRLDSISTAETFYSVVWAQPCSVLSVAILPPGGAANVRIRLVWRVEAAGIGYNAEEFLFIH